MGRAETPAERILRLARYLQETGEVTLERIVDELDGYDGDQTGRFGLRKQLRRDLDTLRDSFGILVDYDPADGCYRMQPPFLTEDERRALLAAAATVTVEGLDGSPLGELGTTLDDQSARVVVDVHRRVSELSPPIATRTPVRFRYHGRDRTVEPYAMGAWRNRWYLVGWEHESERRNRYRLDRIVEPVEGPALVAAGDPESFTVPADFDAAAELRMDPNAWGHDPPVTAAVHVAADHLASFLYEFEATVVDADDRTVAVEVRHRSAFLLRLLGFRDHVRLLGPPELVAELHAWLAGQAGAA